MKLSDFCLIQGRRLLKKELTMEQYLKNVEWFKSKSKFHGENKELLDNLKAVQLI